MDQTTLLYIMAGFTCVAAIALVIQACLMFGMYKATVALTERVTAMLPKVEALMDTSRVTIEESRATIDAFCRYSHDQGVTRTRMTADDLFPREVRASAKI